MNKNLSSVIVICLCCLCLIVGIFNSYQNKDNFNKEDSKKSSNKNKIISTDAKVGVIDLAGVIENTGRSSSLFSDDYSPSNALKSLRMAVDDKDVKGIILRINSPGGTVAMSQTINEEVLRVRDKKPIIVLIEDIAASGGYYIACAADRIIAHEGSLTGSIGVIMSSFDVHRFLEDKLSVESVVIKSGKFKDIGSGYREMTDEERQLLQDIINDSYEQFISTIIKGRINRNDTYTAQKKQLNEKVLRSIADGRIFTGRQAYKYGLVDSLGGIHDAQAMMQTMVNERFKSKAPVKLVSYNKKATFNEYLFGITESIFNNNIQAKDYLPVSMRLSKRPLYLWE